MKISAEGFDYDKKGDIEGLRYNVLLKFGYNKKTKSIFNIEICLKMKYSSSRSDRLNILSDQTFYIYLCYPIVNP